VLAPSDGVTTLHQALRRALAAPASAQAA
jgi:hypothetical protein